MLVRFLIHYQTNWGQKLYVCGSLPELGSWNPDQAAEMRYLQDGYWELVLIIPGAEVPAFEYKYFVLHEQHNSKEWEWGEDRRFQPDFGITQLLLTDAWRPAQDLDNVMYSSAFTKALLARPERNGEDGHQELLSNHHRFQVYAPRVGSNQVVCILGSDPGLGAWDPSKAVLLNDRNYPLWQADVSLKEGSDQILYKYAIYDLDKQAVSFWEEGQDRSYRPIRQSMDSMSVVTDEKFHYQGPWKGAGVAIPVSALRTEQSLGVGEFLDLIPATNWAHAAGLKLIQVLPVNDTVATHQAHDSSPYSAVSCFALHMLYLNLDDLAKDDEEILAEIHSQKAKMNALSKVDYLAVMKIKEELSRKIFLKNRDAILADPGFQEFFEQNKDWLEPYGAFAYLRDINGTANFNRWKTHNTYDQAEIEEFVKPEQPHFDDVALHYFVQFNLHRQLLRAAEYARTHGVILKGDIPIGVRGESVDSWATPEQFYIMNQAGAPPDDFSPIGQNWGFPTYNWEHMAQNDYSWWRARLKKMAAYFDAYRVDHILGFFRIWEIPEESVQGLMGHFNPHLPMQRGEIEGWGLWFDYDRFCKPYIRQHMLDDIFGDQAESVKQNFLEEYAPGCFNLAPGFETQKQIKLHFIEDLDFPKKLTIEEIKLLNGLYSLVSEVLFLRSPLSDEEAYNPRITLHNTYSYKALLDWQKHVINELYIHYYYKRHEQFWADQGRIRLPVIKEATDMLVCGEDLGMVPDSVPGVMNEVGILGLSIESMPKKPTEQFAHPKDCPYLCVCSTSCHDMVPLRSWWEQDRSVTQDFFRNVLGRWDTAPYYCEPWVVRDIVLQHLHSPAMWAIFPIQDLLALSDKLRLENPHDELVNIPGIEHHWDYRMHISFDELNKHTEFAAALKQLMDQTHRNLTC